MEMASMIPARLARHPLLMLMVFLAALFLTGARSSWSDALDTWYASDAHAASYQAARPELTRIFSEAHQRRLPRSLLMVRLLEGVAKGVPSDRLVSAMRGELNLLSRARLIVEKAKCAGNIFAPLRDQTLKDIAIYLRSGLSDGIITDLMAAGAGRPGGKESALAACGAIMDLRAVAPLQDADSLQIGKLLMASGMQPSGYASLALVYGLGRSRGLSHEALVHDVIINTLSNGGGLSVMTQKIETTPIAEPLPQPVIPHAHPVSAADAPGKRSTRR
jgi:hypothetical protein